MVDGGRYTRERWDVNFFEEGGTISNQRKAKKEVRWQHEARTPKAEGEATKCKRGGNDDKLGVSCKLEEQNKQSCVYLYFYIYLYKYRGRRGKRGNTLRKRRKKRNQQKKRESQKMIECLSRGVTSMHLFLFDGCLVVLRSLIVL